MLTIGSLFAGYGGLDIGIQQAIPARTAWVSEIDPGACKVLAHRYPDVPNHGDVTRIDWSQVEPVDIITGGFPCQDVSTAGRRAGLAAGTRSGLWSEMARAIDNIRPSFVLIENVRGLTSASAASDVEPCAWCLGDDTAHAMRALGAVLGDLADLGFDAEWRGLRAADVGACHGRFRVFLLAWRRAAFADADHAGLQGHADSPRTAQAGRHGHAEPGAGRPDLTLLPSPTARLGHGRGASHPDRRKELNSKRSGELDEIAAHLLPTPVSDNSRGLPSESTDFQSLPNEVAHRFGQYAAAIARHEQAAGRPAPAPTEPGHKGQPRLAARFVEWMQMLPAGWITDVPGVTRTQALKMLGNGVVPNQAAAALRHMFATLEAEARAA